MSYCRWSSDNWKSDLYVYESDSGFEIHVAANRTIGDAPEVPDLITGDPGEWLIAYKAQMAWLDEAQRIKIDLPYAGESFTEDTAEEAVERLKALQELGYHVPQYAIEELEKVARQG